MGAAGVQRCRSGHAPVSAEPHDVGRHRGGPLAPRQPREAFVSRPSACSARWLLRCRPPPRWRTPAEWRGVEGRDHLGGRIHGRRPLRSTGPPGGRPPLRGRLLLPRSSLRLASLGHGPLRKGSLSRLEKARPAFGLRACPGAGALTWPVRWAGQQVAKASPGATSPSTLARRVARWTEFQRARWRGPEAPGPVFSPGAALGWLSTLVLPALGALSPG